jgi:signal transduction histidine kinase
MNEINNLNKLFEKQLKKYELSLDSMPNDLLKWQQFITQVNTFYNNSIQELDDTQRLAHIGRWHYNKPKNKITFSKEFCSLFNIDPKVTLKTYEEIQHWIHFNDSAIFSEMIETAFKSGEIGECDIRVSISNKQFSWFHIICEPIANAQGKFEDISGIAMDISKRKEAEEKINNLNKQIILSARYTGMAEVATSLLHNLGNVLNSANVSLQLLKESVNQPFIDRALKVIELIDEHKLSLSTFLTEDAKGKLIPQYLIELSTILKKEQEILRLEVMNMISYLSHIKQIVSTQQDLSASKVFIEKIFLPEAIDLALQMCAGKIMNSIQIKKKYASNVSFVETDKSKLLQILINLIQNAKEAIVDNSDVVAKEIHISAKVTKNNNFEIAIRDNGIGIAPEHQDKLFSFGFTTKKQGHGFGLHSCALFAKELGGDIQVFSEGLGKGATFTLNIPVTPVLKEKI